MTRETTWFVIFPEGSSWVAVEMDGDRLVNTIEQANAETHMRANDRFARICEAVRDSETSVDVLAEDAERIVNAWDSDTDPECCVVEQIVLPEDDA